MNAAPRIGLIGHFGTGNFGNDGCLEAVAGYLRATLPDSRLVCICPAPERVSAMLAIPAIPLRIPGRRARAFRRLGRLRDRLRDWTDCLAEVRRLDALLVPGTGILDDFGTGPFGMPYDLVRWCLAARLTGVRIGFLSIGAGPARSRACRQMFGLAARLAHHRSYRDQASKEFVASLGLDTSRDEVFPDVAFRLPLSPAAEPPGASLSSAPPTGAGRPLTVGLGVMAYFGWSNDSGAGAGTHEAYVDELVRFGVWLLDRGLAVRLLMGETTDRSSLMRVRDGIAARRPGAAAGYLIAEPAGGMRDLLAQIGRTDLVVATRYHVVLCALRLDRPTISLGYAGKNAALMADMGLERFCQHVDRLDAGLLREQFDALAGDRETHVRHLRRHNRDVLMRLHRQDELLHATIIGPSLGRAGPPHRILSPAPAETAKGVEP